MQHVLKLHSARRPVQHWRDVIRRQDAMNKLLKEFVSNGRAPS